ncbi:MAG: hypothetical protein ACI4A7_01915 [Prevotella sp.]
MDNKEYIKPEADIVVIKGRNGICDVDIPTGPGDPVSGDINDAKSNIEYGYEDDTDTPSYIKEYSPWED